MTSAPPDAAALARAYAAGTLSPLEVTQDCLARIARWQPHANAFTHVDAAGALAAAADSTARWRAGAPRGPLDGVPATVKDCLHVAGMPTTWGSHTLGDFRPAADESAVAALRAAGAVLLGKTNCPEFTMQGYTGNPRFGVTRNPWNLALTPGGSSGGAVAALAAGCGAIALATDGGGSIRRPAGYGGLVGFKPSAGAVPAAGSVPAMYLQHEAVGAMARSMADLVATLRVIARPGVVPEALAPPVSPRVLAIARFGEHPVDAPIAAAFDAALDTLRGLGAQVTVLPRFDGAEAVNAQWMLLAAVGLAWVFEHAPQRAEFGARAPDESQLGPALQANLALGRRTPSTAFFALLDAVKTLDGEVRALFAAHDLIVTPSAAAMPWPAADTHPPVIGGQPVGPRGHAVFTAIGNACGLPGLTLPCGVHDGLPIGLQVLGPAGADARVLAFGLQAETALKPPLAWPEPPAG
jgi:aspartyl-tRNA(Asn)/glutamyl-tRNA(Gln) amidotransferase subunit A